MSETGENYTTFNSRSLIEVVGDVTDEALKATKIKQLLSVLAGRFFNWAGVNLCSPSILESNAVPLKWRHLQLRDLTVTDSEYFSAQVHVNPMYCL